MQAEKPTQAADATEAVIIPRHDGGRLLTQAQEMADAASTIVIDSPEMFEEAAYELKQVQSRIDRLEAMRTSVSKPLNDALKAHNAMFKAPAEVLKRAEVHIKGLMLSWQDKVEREARQARIQAEEAARLQREAEAQRAAELRRQAEQAANDDHGAREHLLEQAQAAELSAAVIVAAAPVVAEAKVSGISTRRAWKAKVTDKLALLQHIVAHHQANPGLIELLEVNESRLNALAKALESGLALPGVLAYEERTVASRRAA